MFNKSKITNCASGFNLFLTELYMNRKMERHAKNVSGLFIGLPKCGRTWHRVMFGYYLSRLINTSPKNCLNLTHMCQGNNIPILKYSHNGSEWTARLPISSKYFASSKEWTNKKVMLIIRNLDQVLVSAYNHARFRNNEFDGTLSEFIRGDNTGIIKMLYAMNRWYEQRHKASKFEVLTYDQMRNDPKTALVKTLQFAEISVIDNALIQESIEFSSIENMRKYEDSNFFERAFLNKQTTDPRGRKVRVGNLTTPSELTEDDADYINEKIKLIGNPFASYLIKY